MSFPSHKHKLLAVDINISLSLALSANHRFKRPFTPPKPAVDNNIIDLCTPSDSEEDVDVHVPVKPLHESISAGEAMITISLQGPCSHKHLTVYLITDMVPTARCRYSAYRLKPTGEDLSRSFTIDYTEAHIVEVRSDRHIFPNTTFPLHEISREGSLVTYCLDRKALVWYRKYGGRYKKGNGGRPKKDGAKKVVRHFGHGDKENGVEYVRAIYKASNGKGVVG